MEGLLQKGSHALHCWGPRWWKPWERAHPHPLESVPAQEGGEGVGVCGKVCSRPWHPSLTATFWAALVPCEEKGCGYDLEDLSQLTLHVGFALPLFRGCRGKVYSFSHCWSVSSWALARGGRSGTRRAAVGSRVCWLWQWASQGWFLGTSKMP